MTNNYYSILLMVSAGGGSASRSFLMSKNFSEELIDKCIENKYIFECDRESVDLRTDTQRLQQVIINLLSNADKFTRNGKITLKLEVDDEKRVATFSVSDTGTGIPLAKQKLVFERFEKLNEYVQGTGLGLSICKLTVEKWGGEIWVDPGYTDGARFVFTHPFEIEQPNK